MTGSQSACCRTPTHAQRTLNHKKNEKKNKPATSQPPTWLQTRPRCTSLEGTNAEPKIRLATPKHDKTKTFSKQQSEEQHRVTSNIVFNTNLSATTARDLPATKIVSVRRRDCALRHLKTSTSCERLVIPLACAFRGPQRTRIVGNTKTVGTCHATRLECLGRKFFLTIDPRLSPKHRPTLQ